MRKTLSVILALVLIVAFTAPAFAATTFKLPTTPHKMDGVRAEWRSDGLDGIPTEIPRDILLKSTGIVFEMPEPGSAWKFIWGAPSAGWWAEHDNAGVWADGKLTIKWADQGINPEKDMVDDLGPDEFDSNGNPGGPRCYFGILFADWSTPYEDFGVTGVYLTGNFPSDDAPANTPGTSNPKTGDTTMIALAIGALVLASGAVIILARKVKA
jgi:LPXTG-motif cell wall-anchored protein